MLWASTVDLTIASIYSRTVRVLESESAAALAVTDGRPQQIKPPAFTLSTYKIALMKPSVSTNDSCSGRSLLPLSYCCLRSFVVPSRKYKLLPRNLMHETGHECIFLSLKALATAQPKPLKISRHSKSSGKLSCPCCPRLP